MKHKKRPKRLLWPSVSKILWLKNWDTLSNLKNTPHLKHISPKVIHDTLSRIKTYMPQKEALLKKNLNDQLLIQNNTFLINQVRWWFNFSQPQRFNSSIRSRYQSWHFTLDNATWNSAVVDFANETFGWWVLRNWFVQEEKMLIETNIVSEAWKFNSLDKDPLYIQCKQTHRFVWQWKRLYWNRKNDKNSLAKASITDRNVSNYLQKTKPTDVNIIAMAALDCKSNKYNQYKTSNLEKMFLCAYKGFNKHAEIQWKTKKSRSWPSEVIPAVVHTWARWAWAFGNSENVTCVLQILAAQAAWVQLIYHWNKQCYEAAIQFLSRPQIQWKPYKDVFNSICNYMCKTPNWKKYWAPKS